MFLQMKIRIIWWKIVKVVCPFPSFTFGQLPFYRPLPWGRRPPPAQTSTSHFSFDIFLNHFEIAFEHSLLLGPWTNSNMFILPCNKARQATFIRAEGWGPKGFIVTGRLAIVKYYTIQYIFDDLWSMKSNPLGNKIKGVTQRSENSSSWINSILCQITTPGWHC